MYIQCQCFSIPLSRKHIVSSMCNNNSIITTFGKAKDDLKKNINAFCMITLKYTSDSVLQ